MLTFCPVWTCIGLFCHSLCECIYASVLLCLEASVSLESSIPSGPYSLSEGLFIKHLVLSWVFPISLCLHTVQVWVSVLITTYCEKQLLWWEQGDARIYEWNTVPLGVVLWLCSLSRKNSSRFCPMIYNWSRLRFLVTLAFIMCGLHFTEWAINPIASGCLLLYHDYASTSCRPVSLVGCSTGSWAKLMITFSLVARTKPYLPAPWMLVSRGEAPGCSISPYSVA